MRWPRTLNEDSALDAAHKVFHKKLKTAIDGGPRYGLPRYFGPESEPYSK